MSNSETVISEVFVEDNPSIVETNVDESNMDSSATIQDTIVNELTTEGDNNTNSEPEPDIMVAPNDEDSNGLTTLNIENTTDESVVDSNNANNDYENVSPISHTSPVVENTLDAEVNRNLEVVDKVYHIVKDNLRGLELNMGSVTILVTKVVAVADRVKKMDGANKKQLVSDVCLRMIKNDMQLPENEVIFISITISTLIDLIVQVSKGKFKINLKKKDKSLSNIAPSQVIDSLIDKLVTIVKNRNYSAQDIVINISVITGMVMTIVEQYPDFTGVEKKNMVIRVIRKLIREELPKLVDIPDNVETMLNMSLDTLPETIDILIAIAKGKFKINAENGRKIVNLLLKCLMPMCKDQKDLID